MDFEFTPDKPEDGKEPQKFTFTMEDKPDNIVLFPKQKQDSPPQTVEDIKSSVAKKQNEIAEDIALGTISKVILEVSRQGFDVFKDSEVLAYDLAIVAEGIKSVILRSCNIEHPFQKLDIEIEYLDEFVDYVELLRAHIRD